MLQNLPIVTFGETTTHEIIEWRLETLPLFPSQKPFVNTHIHHFDNTLYTKLVDINPRYTTIPDAILDAATISRLEGLRDVYIRRGRQSFHSLIDIEDFSISRQFPLLHKLLQQNNRFAPYYPDLVSHIHIINVGWLAKRFWNVIEPYIPQGVVTTLHSSLLDYNNQYGKQYDPSSGRGQTNWTPLI